jgi:hypothetical protein
MPVILRKESTFKVKHLLDGLNWVLTKRRAYNSCMCLLQQKLLLRTENHSQEGNYHGNKTPVSKTSWKDKVLTLILTRRQWPSLFYTNLPFVLFTSLTLRLYILPQLSTFSGL